MSALAHSSLENNITGTKSGPLITDYPSSLSLGFIVAEKLRTKMRSLQLLGGLSLLLVVPETLDFKAHDFKTCSLSGFCRRGRALSARAKEAKSAWKSA